ncbi:MAG: MBL fold metallo-hydrolase [Lachnospiraceae bacterium]|nr:MBL fold metallo-hydrolase [Lachnospiraceae bacterium]
MNKKLWMVLFLIMSWCGCLVGCSVDGNVTTQERTTMVTAEENSEAQDNGNTQENAIAGIETDEQIGNYGSADANSLEDGDTLEVHYIDVGQGDSILIRQGDQSMLIDAGNNNKGTTVWSYLLHQNVDHLTYAIGTHPDADHIGGMDVVLYKIDCDTVMLPACASDTKTYDELIQTIGQREQTVVTPEQGQIYTLGKASFQILTDTDKNYGDNTNDYSLAFRLTFGDTSFLFTGDAEKAAEQDMIASGLTIQADVFKAAHHGADTANTEDFLTAVHPTYCVISCGEGNSYGHPRAGVLNQLREMGVKVFRTDEQGTIVATSDGSTITWNTSPSESWQAGEPTGSAKERAEQEENSDVTGVAESETTEVSQSRNEASQGDYILNANTKKFHRPTCASVKRMSDANKIVSTESREALIEQGYEPCKNCNP